MRTQITQGLITPLWIPVRRPSALDEFKVVDSIPLVSGATFFDGFDYFTGYDPTGGFVHYLDKEQSAQYVRIICCS